MHTVHSTLPTEILYRIWPLNLKQALRRSLKHDFVLSIASLLYSISLSKSIYLHTYFLPDSCWLQTKIYTNFVTLKGICLKKRVKTIGNNYNTFLLVNYLGKLFVYINYFNPKNRKTFSKKLPKCIAIQPTPYMYQDLNYFQVDS